MSLSDTVPDAWFSTITLPPPSTPVASQGPHGSSTAARASPPPARAAITPDRQAPLAAQQLMT